jgi:hypothetical protein
MDRQTERMLFGLGVADDISDDAIEYLYGWGNLRLEGKSN